MPRSQLVLSVIGGLVGLLFAFLLFQRFGEDPGAGSELRGFEILSDSEVRVDLRVEREPGTDVFCVVRARGRTGAEVGRSVFDVPPTQDATVQLSRTFTTTAEPITGELVGCSVGQADDVPPPPPEPSR